MAKGFSVFGASDAKVLGKPIGYQFGIKIILKKKLFHLFSGNLGLMYANQFLTH